jgi:hypothetical protein
VNRVYSIELWTQRSEVEVRDGVLTLHAWEGDPSWSMCQLGTERDPDKIGEWMSGAYRNGLLPEPPSYHDEIRVYAEPSRERAQTFRLGWVEVQPLQRLIV